MKLRRRQLAAALVLVLCVTIGVLVWSRRPTEVRTLEVRVQPTELALTVVGRARPLDLVQVASPNPGQVIELFRDDGDVVAAGAPLAVIRADVEQAQVEADAARVRAAEAEAAEARLDYNRTRTLFERGFAAQAAVDAARTSLQAAEANVTAASASARASAERAREFTIRAPMDGVVLVRPVDSGQVVGAGETLFELGSSEGVEIRVEVEEAYADALRPGQNARAALAGSDRVFAAVVFEVSPQVDPSTGGRLIKLRPEAGASIPPGRSVDLTIVVERRPAAISVPRSALIDANSEPKVYVVDEGDQVRVRPVTVVRWPSVDAVIERGLSGGDRVVLDPASVKAGERVRPTAGP
jgi:RND family efflux transporter MFP subunit